MYIHAYMYIHNSIYIKYSTCTDRPSSEARVANLDPSRPIKSSLLSWPWASSQCRAPFFHQRSGFADSGAQRHH